MKNIKHFDAFVFESDLNESINFTGEGFEKWGQGHILRLPKGSQPMKNIIRMEVTPSGSNWSVVFAVNSNEKVRAEIQKNPIFNQIADLLKTKGTGQKWEEQKHEGNITFSTLSGIVPESSLLKITSLLKGYTPSIK